MTQEQWQQVWNVYRSACETPPEERARLIESALSDAALRGKVLELLSNLDGDADADADPEPAQSWRFLGHKLGRFEIVEAIGSGGMGEVYRAFDPELDRNVAVKCIAPGRLGSAPRAENFIREARAASALNHPGIVTIHEVIRTEDTVAIVMELAEGRPLRTFCGSPQPVLQVAEWGRQIAGALAASHAAGVVHRDIKPENMMLRNDGLVKILDFGLARRRSDMNDTEEATAGTIRYMSPEQAQGRDVTGATDIFSLGVVLYELATSVHPFDPADGGQTSVLVFAQAITEQQERPIVSFGKSVPSGFTDLVTAMMAKDAAARPSTTEVARRLADLAAGKTRSRVPWIAAALALAAVAALAVWRPWVRPVPPAPPMLQATLLTGAPGSEGEPVFSPDSNLIAYAWDGGDGGGRDIYVKPLGAGDPVRLTDGSADAWEPAWSPDGSSIAFLRQGGGTFEVAVVPAAGGPSRLITRLAPAMKGLLDRLTWSADPDSLVVADAPPGENETLALYRVSLQTGDRRLLGEVDRGAADISPRTSPDRRWIAFLRVRGAEQGIRVLPATGGASRLLNAGRWRGLAWPSDSKHIIGGFGDGVFDQILQLPLDGGKPAPASFRLENRISDLSFSPDGRRLAYVRRARDSTVWKISAGGVAPTKLTSSTRADDDGAYSRNGEWIAFSSNRSGVYEIWVAAAEGRNARKLTDLKGYSASPAWSPDGRFVAFDSNAGDHPRVHVAAADGSGARVLTPDMFAMVPSWSNDGRWIYFSSEAEGTNQTWRVASQGGTPEQLTRHGGFEARESPDGKFLYYSKSGAKGIWRMALPPEGRGEEQMVVDFDPSLQFRCWDVTAAGIVAGRPGKVPQLELARFAGGPPVRLASLPKSLPIYGRCISAHPGGRAVLYSVDDAIHQEIFLADLPR